MSGEVQTGKIFLVCTGRRKGTDRENDLGLYVVLEKGIFAKPTAKITDQK